MRFSLKQMLIGVTAIAVLLPAWPPYRFTEGTLHEKPGFNEGFWAVVGIELFVWAWLALLRLADSVRHERDEL